MHSSSLSDPALLAQWLDHRSDGAFRELVDRYAGLVHGTARRTCGDDAMAAEVAQLTFIALARKAKSLAGYPSLAGWLHRTAILQARNQLRQATREHRKRELLQAAMEPPSPAPDDAWQALQPILDDALAALSAKDREALLLRFYRSLSVKEIAATLGIATDAAQKRVDRATDRLRGKLLRRGCQTGGSLSAVMLAGFASDAQAAAFAVPLFTAKAISAGAATSTTTAFLTASAMKTTSAVGGAVIALVLVTIVLSINATKSRRDVYESNDHPGAQGWSQRDGVRSSGAPPPRRDSKPPGSLNNPEALRKQHLERLKARWMSLKSPDDATGVHPIMVKAMQDLARESAELLLISPEAIELMVYLDANGMTGGYVLDAIRNDLKSPRADAILMHLAGLPENIDSFGRHYPQDLAVHAGLMLPAEKLDEILPNIRNKDIAQEMMIGQNVVLAKSNPQAAVVSALQILGNNRSTMSRMDSLEKVMDNLPAGVDYQKVLEMLPATKAMDQDSPITRALPPLLGKWAKTDPAGAANFLIANPDRNNEYVMGAVVEAVCKGDPWRGVEWVQSFPEGPVFDTAARTAAAWIGWDHPDEARKLAEMIGDKKLRLAALRSIQDAQGEKAGGGGH